MRRKIQFFFHHKNLCSSNILLPSSDHFTINGRITYQPAHSPSKSASQMSHLIYLSVDTFMQCPRKPIGKGNPEPKYLKLVENSTVFEPSKKKKRSESTTITEEERHPDMKTVEENLAQPQQRQALSPIVGLLSTNSISPLPIHFFSPIMELATF